MFVLKQPWNQILSSLRFTFLCEWGLLSISQRSKSLYLLSRRQSEPKQLVCSARKPGLYFFQPVFEEPFSIRYLPQGRMAAWRGEIFSPISKATWSFREFHVWNVSKHLSKMNTLSKKPVKHAAFLLYINHWKVAKSMAMSLMRKLSSAKIFMLKCWFWNRAEMGGFRQMFSSQTSTFILVWYGSFHLATKVSVFVHSVCLKRSPKTPCFEIAFWKY